MSQLTKAQRYTISVMRKQDFPMGEIAAAIGKHKSTISRELRRNCDRRSGRYDADLAQRKCERRQKEKPHRVRFTEEVRLRVEAMLGEDYSPEQVVGRCRLEGLECVSVETIYQYVWGDKRRGGDLEIDLVMGANHRRALLSANDRASGISWIALLEGKDSKALADKAAEMLMPFKGLLHTVTSDNGKEFAEHKAIAKSLAVDYYFAHPYHSWKRGANENMNGLIRQYLPKGTPFDGLDDNEIKRIRDKLNNRPRKKLGFLTPIEYFFANFAPELNLSLTQKVAFVT